MYCVNKEEEADIEVRGEALSRYNDKALKMLSNLWTDPTDL